MKRYIKPLKSIATTLPMMMGIIMILGLIKVFISYETLSTFFTDRPLIDTIIGSLAGSIFAGNSMNSYIIAGELGDAGISLFAITAFLISWVTVGLVQLPLEAKLFGKDFAFARNGLSALLAIVISFLVVGLWGVL